MIPFHQRLRHGEDKQNSRKKNGSSIEEKCRNFTNFHIPYILYNSRVSFDDLFGLLTWKNEHSEKNRWKELGVRSKPSWKQPSRSQADERMARSLVRGGAKVASCYFVAGDTPLREGGGEPSLEYYEDLYGSLRMPLSIWVILRIYNEDAMPAPPPPPSIASTGKGLEREREISRHRGAPIGANRRPSLRFRVSNYTGPPPRTRDIRFGEDNADNARIMSGIAGGKVQILFRPRFFHIIPADKTTGVTIKKKSILIDRALDNVVTVSFWAIEIS